MNQLFLYAAVWEIVTKKQQNVLTHSPPVQHLCGSGNAPSYHKLQLMFSFSFSIVVSGQLRNENQKYVFGVVDGQHRLGALLLLSEEGLWDRSERNVVVEVFDTKDDKEIEELFAEINK